MTLLELEIHLVTQNPPLESSVRSSDIFWWVLNNRPHRNCTLEFSLPLRWSSLDYHLLSALSQNSCNSGMTWLQINEPPFGNLLDPCWNRFLVTKKKWRASQSLGLTHTWWNIPSISAITAMGSSRKRIRTPTKLSVRSGHCSSWELRDTPLYHAAQ